MWWRCGGSGCGADGARSVGGNGGGFDSGVVVVVVVVVMVVVVFVVLVVMVIFVVGSYDDVFRSFTFIVPILCSLFGHYLWYLPKSLES